MSAKIELLKTWPIQNTEGRARAAQIVGDLKATRNAPAFRKECETVLGMAEGVRVGFWAELADRLA